MARTFTRGQLRDRLTQITDIENDNHIVNDEKDAILNSAMAETWDCIVDAGLAEKYVKSNTFNTAAGTQEYALATVAGSDFYRVHQVYANEGNGQLRALQHINPAEILNFRAPAAVVPMKIYYIPICPVLTIGSGGDASTFDGINGWEEHTLMTAACAIKLKRQEDYRPYAARKAELEARIASMGTVDFGDPPRVSRKRKPIGYTYYPYFSQINAYLIRGDKIELFYSYPWVR
jgi:hypothetical protein